MSWNECCTPAYRYGRNAFTEPLSSTSPDTPCATLTEDDSIKYRVVAAFSSLAFRVAPGRLENANGPPFSCAEEEELEDLPCSIASWGASIRHSTQEAK